MTATKTYTVHRKHTCVIFDDLPHDMQKRILDQYAYDETAFVDWWGFGIDEFCDTVTEKYGLNVNGRKCYFNLYPLSAAWTLSYVDDWDKLLDALCISDESERAFLKYWESHVIRFTAKPSDYVCHSTCQYSSIEYWTYGEDEVTDPSTLYGLNPDQQEALFLRIERAWDNLAANIAHELGKLMEDEYEYLTSEKYLRERMEENGDIFDIETGMVFNREDVEEE